MSVLPAPTHAAVSSIEGVRVVALAPHRDARGEFVELYKDSWRLPIRPAQWSAVWSEPRTLRGLYLHLRHDELFVLLSGRAYVGLKDLRPGSASRNLAELIPLDARAPSVVVFPAGVLHGWYFSEPSLHMQAVSEEYESYRHDDNLACHWADPDVGLPWPDPKPLLSPESAGFGSLAALLRRVS